MTEDQPISSSSDEILLVDLSSIGHPIWHVSQQEPDPDYTSQRTVAVVYRLAADHPHAAICCDSATSFRKDLDASYKANRPAQEAALYHQIDLAREALAADGFPCWRVDGFEGDDIIATATAQLLDYLGREQHVLIASADKDVLALVSDRVEVHSTRTGHRLGPAEVKEKMGVEPHQVVDYLTLVGDASDNIQGARGIGPKTAVDLLGGFGLLDNIFLHLDDGHEAIVKPAQRAALEELRPRLESVRALVTMRTDVPLDVSDVFKRRMPQATENSMEDEMDEKKTALPPPLHGWRERLRQIDLATETPEACDHEASPESEPEFAESVRASQGWSSDLARQPAGARPAAAVAVVEEPAPVEWERGLEPRSMNDAVRLAQRLHDSKMFSAYGTAQGVLATLLLGRELGMPAMASLRSVHVIQGKHSMSADLMVALVLRSGLAEYFQVVESTDTACTFTTKRKGAPKETTLSYTIEQAERAELMVQRPGSQPGNWQKIPTQMLRARLQV